jgi:hypothetical protein
MTKTIRVENADTSPFKVRVQVWDIPYRPEGEEQKPHVLAKTIDLDYPTQMTPLDLCITSSRYLIVKEVEA